MLKLILNPYAGKEKQFFNLWLVLFLLLAFLFEGGLVIADTPDAYEPDNSSAEAKTRIVVDLYNPDVTDDGDPHTFHEFFDEDWIKFTAVENLQYNIKALDPSVQNDPVIELYYMDGTSLLEKRNNFGPGKTESLTWICLEGGTYYVRFTSNTPHVGSDIGYRVSLTTPQPPFTFPGYVTGRITSGGVGIKGARLTFLGGSSISQSDGYYILSLFEGNATINVHKDGYYTSDFTVTVVRNQTIHHDEDLIKIPTPSTPPTISGTPMTTAYCNNLYSFIPTASDPDGDHISFSISNKPGWAHFNPDNGMLVGIPGAADIGTYSSIIITVRDSLGESASLAPFNLEVMKIEGKVFPGIYLLLGERN